MDRADYYVAAAVERFAFRSSGDLPPLDFAADCLRELRTFELQTAATSEELAILLYDASGFIPWRKAVQMVKAVSLDCRAFAMDPYEAMSALRRLFVPRPSSPTLVR